MSKVKIHEFQSLIYPYHIWIAKCIDNIDWINDRFCGLDGQKLELPDTRTAHASTFPTIREKETNNVGVLLILYKQSALTPPVIAHEAVHAVNGMFNYLDINQDCLNDEHYAYALQFIVDCVWQVVTGKFKY